MRVIGSSNADDSARPGVEVRDRESRLIKRVTDDNAAELIRRGWADWIGRGRRRYVRLTPRAPLSSFPSRRDNTQPMRADKSCQIYLPGQLMGSPRHLREHRPTAG